MSSSSLCSTNDMGDSDSERIVSDSLIADIQRFACYSDRLRRSLDPATNVPDGESMCVSVHSALSLVSQSVRDLLVRYPIFKTSQVLLPASQLVHSVKELNFDNSNIDATRTLANIDKLEAAVGNTLKQSLRCAVPAQFSSVTLGRKIRNSSDVPKNGRVLARRHSTYQPKERQIELDSDEMDRLVAHRVDGIDIAFERGKAWAKYCKDLLNYVTRRIQLEADHAKKVQSLANQSKLAMNEHFLPLRNIFNNNFDNELAFCEQTNEAVKHIQDRFIKSLEMRRDDHERQRRALKSEWMRITKQVKDTQQELVRARSLLGSRTDGVKRAQESVQRTESLGPPVGVEVQRRKKEMERKRKNEEDALSKREEAKALVERLEIELKQRQQQMEEAKIRIVRQLRELVYRCDQTTKACSTHYFQALANLWVSQPGKYQEFADATRAYTPGAEYMSFLHTLPSRTISSGSLFGRTGDHTDEGSSSANATTPSSSVSSHRRNAIDIFDQEILLDKKAKKSSVRRFEATALESLTSEAARTHHLQRIRQPTKCAHCDTLSLLSTVQCSQCGMMWHKSCLPRVTVSCGQSTKSVNDSIRRMSIFGVPLQGYLERQGRQVPLILEQCIDELQRRGMKVKGIYRTCGVKSKIEQICEDFERASSAADVDLNRFHPMNIASVVKLYLRKLPEPLLTQALYKDWIAVAEANLSEDENCSTIRSLKALLEKLPVQNYETLRFLVLHLNRITWFEEENLMTASNLGAVISPSMIWKQPSAPPGGCSAFLNDAHLISRVVELLIKNAFEVFDVDRAEDWKLFFLKYPDIEQPPAVDLDADANIDECEDEDDLLDDEGDVLCSPSYVPQPPTPDLLKNTTRGKKESYSTSDDLDLDSSLGSFGGHSRSHHGTDEKSTYSSAPPSANDRCALSRPQKLDKRRSYTTSILVSPRQERKLMLPQRQKSVEGGNPLGLCSIGIIEGVHKGQFYLCNDPSNCSSPEPLVNPSVPVRRRLDRHLSSDPEPSAASTPYMDEDSSGRESVSCQDGGVKVNLTDLLTAGSTMDSRNTDKLCLQSVGVLFSGTDVSYV